MKSSHEGEIVGSVLREIAAQQEREGADKATIRDGIDYREKEVIGDPQLRDALSRLKRAGLIEQRGDRWFVSERFVGELPRTRGGRVSIASEAWRRFERRVEATLRPSKQGVVGNG